MKFEVVALQRADVDARQIVGWIAQHSIQGALSWLDAYEQLLVRLGRAAESYPAAIEASEISWPLKEALFGTPNGRTYRAIFTISGSQVRILRLRGPGQPPLSNDEFL